MRKQARPKGRGKDAALRDADGESYALVQLLPTLPPVLPLVPPLYLALDLSLEPFIKLSS